MSENWLSLKPMLADGAWGTELQKLGLPPGENPDIWNLQHPERVAAVAKSYADAGSRVILTNTFRANRIAMPNADIQRLNQEGLRISREAAGDRALVFASIGPSGKLLGMGDVDEDELLEAFREQAWALCDADALLIETMSDMAEARIALRAAKEAGAMVIVSFAFDTGRAKDRTMTGATPEMVAAEFQDADAIGANCGMGIESAVEICGRLRAATELPLWIKPNAGLPVMVNGEVRYTQSPQAFASGVPRLLQAGATFVGGCCGTSPEFIRAAAPMFS
ncbi:MAG: homocysteine S-methyltransferase family protein [Bryobacteraceae bacterium]|nr:homocysteine S-methyltransferase family protein [Bryobacteraceae bacterium]